MVHQPLQHHVLSLIAHGVFDKFPTLKVIITESGVTWIPWLLWAMDSNYQRLRDQSRISRWPSEYFHDHFGVATQPLEVTPARQLRALLETVDGIEDVICFGTDYPHFDVDDPVYTAKRFPKSWLLRSSIRTRAAYMAGGRTTFFPPGWT